MTNKGAVLLREWLRRRDLKQYEGAKILGYHESYMSLLLDGRRTPRLTVAVKIEKLAGIPCAAWLSSVRDKSQKAARSLVGSRQCLPGENQ